METTITPPPSPKIGQEANQPTRAIGVAKLADNPEEIRLKIDEAYRYATECVASRTACVRAAWEAGKMLMRVRDFLGPRKFAPWVRDKFGSALSMDTVERYIRLSTANVRLIESATSMSHALRIIESSEKGFVEPHREAPAPDTSHVEVFKLYRQRLLKHLEPLTKLIASAPIDDMPDDQKAALMTELKPFTEILEKIGYIHPSKESF